MADVRPFRGLRYGPAFEQELNRVIAGPFDVISPAEQKALYAQSAHNIIRVELGEILPSDSDAENRYTRAAALLHAWLAEQAIVLDPVPAFYVSHHTFDVDGATHSRMELYGQVRLEEWDKKVVLPHEFTLPGAKVDRLHLLRAVKTNVSPVYSLYNDKGGAIARLLQSHTAGAPLLTVSGFRDASFEVWAITDPAVAAAIASALSDQRLYIADGHHRYETALNYRNERRAAGDGDGDEPHNFMLMALTAVDDPGLVVLPLHRLLRGLTGEAMQGLMGGLDQDWVVQRVPFHSDADVASVTQQLRASAAEPSFALYGVEPATMLMVRPKSTAALRAQLPAGMAEPLKELDLSLLHELLFHQYLGIGRTPADVERSLGFEPLAAEAVHQVDSGAYQVAVLVNATRVGQMVAVADAGEKMPQKSTFFFPKLPTGLVLRPAEALAPA